MPLSLARSHGSQANLALRRGSLASSLSSASPSHLILCGDITTPRPSSLVRVTPSTLMSAFDDTSPFGDPFAVRPASRCVLWRNRREEQMSP